MSPNARTVRAVVTFFAVLAAFAVTPRWAGGGAVMGQIPCAYDVAAVIAAPAGPTHASPTFPTAISPNGQFVVGYYSYDAVGYDSPWFWSQATGFMTLPMPPGFYTATPLDINNSRVICGTGEVNGSGRRGFIYDKNTNTFTVLQPQGGSWCGAGGINEAGQVCGTRMISVKGQPAFESAFVWRDGVYTDFGKFEGMATYGMGIAEDGVVAVQPQGTATGGPYAVSWSDQATFAIGPAPGCDSSAPRSIANEGHIVGAGTVIGSGQLWALPFHYVAGSIHMLPVLGGVYDRGNAIGVNGHGTIVCGCRRNVNPANWRACVWKGGQCRNLNGLLPPAPDVTLQFGIGVAENEFVVCSAINAQGNNVAVVLLPHLAITGDTNCDGAVNVGDLLAVVTTWGAADSVGDLNSDFTVDVADLLIVVTHWSR